MTAAILALLFALRGLGIPCEVVQVNVSAYTNRTGAPPFQGLTASGIYTRPGVAACGPDLPFGTMLYIDGVGWAECADRGPEIEAACHDRPGNIDVWMADDQVAEEFGRRLLFAVVVR